MHWDALGAVGVIASLFYVLRWWPGERDSYDPEFASYVDRLLAESLGD